MTPRRERQAPDPRHARVKEALRAYWAAENPEAPDLPWGAAEAGCVGAFLRANPSLAVELIERCLANRLASEDHAPGEGIYRWFRDLLRYQSAPLDRFRLPIRRQHSEATVGMRLDRDPVIAAEMDAFLARQEARMLARHAAGEQLQPWEIEHLQKAGKL